MPIRHPVISNSALQRINMLSKCSNQKSLGNAKEETNRTNNNKHNGRKKGYRNEEISKQVSWKKVNVGLGIISAKATHF